MVRLHVLAYLLLAVSSCCYSNGVFDGRHEVQNELHRLEKEAETRLREEQMQIVGYPGLLQWHTCENINPWYTSENTNP